MAFAMKKEAEAFIQRAIPPLPREKDEKTVDWVRRITYSVRAYKARLTQTINRAKNAINEFEADPNHHTLKILRGHSEKLEGAMAAIRDRYQELLELSTDDQDYEAGETELEVQYKRFYKIQDGLSQAIQKIKLPPQDQITSGGGGMATDTIEAFDADDALTQGTAGRGRVKADTALRPEKLTVENTPHEMREWCDQFKSYYETSNFASVSISSQQAYFKQCLSSVLRLRLEKHLTKQTPIFGDDGCLHFLEEEFKAQYPLGTRRLDYFNCAQQQGQSMSDFVIKVRQLYEEADIADLTGPANLIYKYLSGCNDKELRKKLLEVVRFHEPTVDQVEEFILQWEVTRREDSRIGKSLTAKAGQVKSNKSGTKGGNSGNSNSNKGNNSKSSAAQGIGKKIADLVKQGKCKGCGSANHKFDSCRYKDNTCTRCNKKGHSSGFCLSSGQQSGGNSSNKKGTPAASKAASPATSDDEGASKTSAVTYRISQAKLTDPTPRLSCKVVPTSGSRPGTPFKFNVLPDTGATITVISRDLTKTYGMTVRKSDNERLLAADDSTLDVSGHTRIQIGDVWIKALVSDSLSQEILLGWRDMIRLSIIPEDFPQPHQCFHSVAKATPDHTKRVEEEIKTLFSEFADVLSDELPEKPMHGPAMTIELRDDMKINPRKATTCKETPLHMVDDAQKLVDKLVRDKVIEPVPIDEISDWISPAFFVPKEGGKAGVRLVTDFTQLNRYVKRPVHPFPSANDIAKKISPKARFFCKMDATQGYHQIPLSECAMRLTTFLIPSGKYRYRRGPMGLKSTNDCWCHRSDAAIEGEENAEKIVDDILATAETLEELFKTIRRILTRCRKIGLTISKKKLKISTEVAFAGFVVSQEGIKPDPEKVKAIKEFPSPKDITEVRSFLGLANQLGQFVPDLSMATTKMRGLLKKNVTFQWLGEHEVELDFVKNILTSPLLVQFFDPALPTTLLTDASKLHGLGFALIQHDTEGKIRLIQAGSRSLVPAERNYAPIEQECLGAVWAMEKCRHFLYGCPNFKLVTDHQPLVGIFKKELSEVCNRRLQRFRERVLDYAFDVEWVEGKTHLIADALSRSPLPGGSDQAYYIASIIHSLDPQLDDLRSAASKCPEYKRLLRALQTMDLAAVRRLPATDPIGAYKSIWDELSIYEDQKLILYQADRIFVPKPDRQRILELLHRGHSGIVKTRQLARQLYFWPGLNNDVKQMINHCSACFELLPQQQPLPLVQTEAKSPLEHTSADLFSLNGKNFLAYADRFSGMLWCDKLNSTTTDKVTDLLDKWMLDFGYPKHIRTDGGPQFRGPFDDWCKTHHIVHEVSSPYYPQSNGHAEQAVKSAKHLLKKLDANMRTFREHLYSWRNTPRADGLAPADLFFGRRQRTGLPSLDELSSSNTPVLQKRAEKAAKQKKSFDTHARDLPALSPGQQVALRHTSSKNTWGGTGTIIDARPDARSYTVATEGTETIRNRKDLRVRFSEP